MDFDGKELERGSIEPGESSTQNTHLGHTYRAYIADSHMLMEYVVHSSNPEDVRIEQCDHAGQGYALKHERDTEFRELVHDQFAACDPQEDSSKWSCVRCLSAAEVASRKPEEYGFHIGETTNGHEVGQVQDKSYTHWIPFVPALSSGPGFQKMNMTGPIRKSLLPFFQNNKKATDPALGPNPDTEIDLN